MLKTQSLPVENIFQNEFKAFAYLVRKYFIQLLLSKFKQHTF